MGKFLFYIYNLIIHAGIFLILSLFYLKKQKGLLQRLGYLPEKNINNNKKIILIHTSSVGEINGIIKLKENLERYKDCRVIVSVYTTTGYNYAKRLFKRDIFYFPFDFPYCVSRFLKHINPYLIIISEAEYWPNFLVLAKRMGIKICLINGIISDKSYKKYKFIKKFFSFILENFDLLSMQTEEYAKRIISLGAKEDKVKVTGNCKFDLLEEKIPAWTINKQALTGKKIFAAGSVRKKEDKIIIEVFKELLKEIELFLVICPRHLKRVKPIKKLLNKYNLTFVESSRIKDYIPWDIQVLLVDTVGELTKVYSIADIVFVGGSLVNLGGHNIAEPCILKKPVLFGEYIYNYKDIASELLKKRAAIQVKNKNELKQNIQFLLKNEKIQKEIGQKAYSVIKSQQNATSKNLKLILELL